jgi:hypothetical protein
MSGAAVRAPDAELQTHDTLAAGYYKVGGHQCAAAIAKASGALLKQVLTQPFLKALPGDVRQAVWV